MKLWKFLSFSAILGYGAMQPAFAVQFTVEDVSNRIITCQGPLVDHQLLPGTCIAFPEATLALTATLDTGEDPSALDEIDYVIVRDGFAYHFNSDGALVATATERWQPMGRIPPDIAGLSFERPSTQRLPFETRSVWRMIPMGSFYGQKGVRLFAGAKKSVDTGYLLSRVKMVYEGEE